MIPKRWVKVLRKKTCVTLEDPFWEALKEIAGARGTNRNVLINAVARDRAHGNLSSALRVLVLEHFRSVIAKQEQGGGLMFVRFRQEATRLRLSLIDARLVDGVRREHITSLGSIDLPLSVEGRLAFWHQLHERIAKVANRIDAAKHGKVLAAVHARIPIVTVAEQQAVQPENAQADARFSAHLHPEGAR